MKFIVRNRRADPDSAADIVKADREATAVDYIVRALGVRSNDIEVTAVPDDAIENIEIQSVARGFYQVRTREKGIDKAAPWGPWRAP